MAIVINGSGTVTGITAGGLPDGIITADDLASTGTFPAWSGANLTDVGGGKILQVVQSTFSTQTSYTPSSNGVYTDTGLNVSITPSSTSSKILLMFNVSLGSNYNNRRIHLRINGGNATDYQGGGTQARASAITIEPRAGDDYRQLQGVLTYVDSPATTSSTTYTLQVSNEGGGGYHVYLNRASTIDDYTGECKSTAIAMEIGA